MTNEAKRTYILTTIVCLIPILVGIVLYSKLPDQVVIHWNAAGEPDNYASKFFGAIVLPGILLVVNLIFPLLLKMDPKYDNMSEKVKNLLHWIIPVIQLFATTITLSSALGADLNVKLYAPMFMGILFIIIGNFMPKMSQTYTVGIKLPWTLADEENWNKTHRMAGFLWVVCGILMVVFAFTPLRFTAFMVMAVVMVLAPTVYSYMLYRQKK